MVQQNLGRLGRLFLNSKKFFWGVFDSKQADTYKRLDNKYGLKFSKVPYHPVMIELLNTYGADRLKNIACQEVRDNLSPELLQKLSDYWRRGECPTTFEEIGVRPGDGCRGMLDVEWIPSATRPITYTYRIGGWGEFAAIFFEYGNHPSV